MAINLLIKKSDQIKNYADLQALFTALGSENVTLKINKEITISTNTVCPENIKLNFIGNGKLTINSTYNITFHSPRNILNNGNYIFNDLNTNRQGVIFTNIGTINLGWFFDNSATLITNAWSSCIYCIEQASGGKITIPKRDDYTHSNYVAGAQSQLNGPLSNIVIEGNGSVITYTNDVAIRDPFIEFFVINNLKITDLEINGNVSNTGAGAGIICKLMSCDNFTINNVYFHDAQYDCFYLGAQEAPTAEGECIGGVISNFRFSAGQRNNISLIGAIGITFQDGRVDDNANTAFAAAPKMALDIEPSIAGVNVFNVTFKNVQWDNNLGGASSINATSSVREIKFDNCKFVQHLSKNSSCFDFESKTQGLKFDTCEFLGYGVIDGNAHFNNCKFNFDDTITSVGGGANYCIRFNATASHSIIENCEFQISRSASNGFVVFSDRNGNSSAETFIFRNNKFTAAGNSLGSKLIDLGSIYPDDIILYEYNRFLHSGAAPGTPYYILGPISKSVVRLGDGNIFSDNFTLDNSPIEWYSEATIHNRLFVSKQKRISLSGASVTWTNPIQDGAVLITTKAKITTQIVIGGGGTNWRVGDGVDVDRWGDSNVLTVNETLNTADWTADTNTPIMSETSVVITPDAGTFSSGVIDVQLIYMLL